ncbi:MAG: toll/interleukin-1 receptor domain-containing protein [Acidobacteriia bacterium]|nr:toll/interleukin-1 receptor domain-containing protein [Terriglobia bacterium]
MTEVFLSYAKEDRSKAANLARVLSDKGWTIFWDREIPIGKNWNDVIEQRIPEAKVVTALWSPSSVKSRWVITEADFGAEHRKLLPVMIEATEVPIAFRLVQYADLTSWDGSSTDHAELKRLFQALVERIGEGSGRPKTRIASSRPALIRSGDSPRKIFLGYARPDHQIAEKLVRALQEHRFSAWWDFQIPIGATFQDTILGTLESAEIVLIIWSQIGVHSPWVLAEAQWALERRKLVSARIQPLTIPAGLEGAPNVDLEDWDGSARSVTFVRLLEAIASV